MAAARSREPVLAKIRLMCVLMVWLLRNWPRLAKQYRAASAEFTSPAKWRETFEASLRDRPGGP